MSSEVAEARFKFWHTKSWSFPRLEKAEKSPKEDTLFSDEKRTHVLSEIFYSIS